MLATTAAADPKYKPKKFPGGEVKQGETVVLYPPGFLLHRDDFKAAILAQQNYKACKRNLKQCRHDLQQAPTEQVTIGLNLAQKILLGTLIFGAGVGAGVVLDRSL